MQCQSHKCNFYSLTAHITSQVCRVFISEWRLFPTTGDTAADTSMFWAKCQISKCHREQILHIKGINRHRLFNHCGQGVKILWNAKSLRPFLRCVQMQRQDVIASASREQRMCDLLLFLIIEGEVFTDNWWHYSAKTVSSSAITRELALNSGVHQFCK